MFRAPESAAMTRVPRAATLGARMRAASGGPHAGRDAGARIVATRVPRAATLARGLRLEARGVPSSYSALCSDSSS
jgi:hypothetical protein